MDVPRLNARLELLFASIGTEVVWRDKSAEEDDDHKAENPTPHIDGIWGDAAIAGTEPEEGTQPARTPTGPSSMTKAREARRQQAYDRSGFVIGQPIDSATLFCPLKAIQTYPAHFIGKKNRPLAKPYFDRVLLDRDWDVFYLHDQNNAAAHPQLLVPTAQFEVFLEEINYELGIALTIPQGINSGRFCVRFGKKTPRPRYLKRSHDGPDLDIEIWPKAHQADIDTYSKASESARTRWNGAFKAVKSPLAAVKANGEKAARKKKARDEMLTRTLSLLGIKGEPEVPDVVFVCIDVEAIEEPPHPVSEVGLAILDTRDLRDIAPGACGENWRQFIHCHHLRVYEYSGFTNSRFVKGCPAAFDYGQSTFPAKADLGDAILSIIQPYSDTRNVALVGHDVLQDFNYIASVGVDLYGLKNTIRHIDTQQIHQAWLGLTNGYGLQKVLSHIEMVGKNLHNAGNDAYYTLCALIGVALKHAAGEGVATGREELPSTAA